MMLLLLLLLLNKGNADAPRAYRAANNTKEANQRVWQGIPTRISQGLFNFLSAALQQH